MFEFFENMTDGVCIFDISGCLKYINASGSRILGLGEPSSLVGKWIVEMIPITQKNDSFMQVFLDYIGNKAGAENLIDIENEDGRIRHVRVSVTQFETDKQTGEIAILMLLTDYTELLKVRNVLERYTSKDIAEAALEESGGDNMRGRLADATVMFCDIRGFTALSAQISATTLVDVINHHFSVMDRIITKYKGTVMEFLGDGILAAFGVPKYNEDHAYRAVACALEMQKAMTEVNEWNEQHDILPFEIGIGINSGLMIAGNIGSKTTMKYQCIGQQVNLAGRIESYSVGGQVLVSKSTIDKINSEVKTRGKQQIIPKGTNTPLEIFDVCAVSGKYSVELQQEQTEMTALSSPVPITFCILDGKAVGSEHFSASILKISDKSALLRTEYALSVNDNIMIRYNGEVYAKVTNVSNEGITIRFTSKPISPAQ